MKNMNAENEFDSFLLSLLVIGGILINLVMYQNRLSNREFIKNGYIQKQVGNASWVWVKEKN